MQTPMAYTLLGIALALGSLAAVGFGGVQWWYLWETTFNDRSDDQPFYGASASCSEPSPAETDPVGVGLDLVLRQDANTDRVTITGLVIGGGVQQGIGITMRLYSDKSCQPKPTKYLAGTVVTPSTNQYAEVAWTVSGYRLDGTGTSLIGDVITIERPSGLVSVCCTITRLPGAGVTSR